MEPLRAISTRTSASRLAVCLLPAACCLLLAGCQNGRRMQADLYQRELRLQEDKIYRLEDYVEEYQAIISGYRCEIAELKRDLAAASTKPSSTRSTTIELPPTDIDVPSILETPKPTDLDPLSAEPFPAGGTTPGDEAPKFKPGGAAPLDEAPIFNGAENGRDRVSHVAEASREPALLQPISATLAATPAQNDNPPHPYPNAAPQRPPAVEPLPELVGDPSIRLFAEMANDPAPSIAVVVAPSETDALRSFSGVISVMLTDPAEDGRTKRIARWDFDESEVRAAVQSNRQGLSVTIALPSETPTDRPLRLWVRMVDRSGNRKLQATDVRFLANPLRLVESEALAESAMLHRLPAPVDDGSNAAVVQSSSGAWRAPSRVAAERRVDSAVAPASFEAW